jgi:hypothetical protein
MRKKPSPPITFDYRFDKVLATLLHLARAHDRVTLFDKKKASSLLFLADKAFVLRYGRPIFGERYWALPEGAVASETLNRLNELQKARPEHQQTAGTKRLAAALSVTTVAGHDYPVYIAKESPDYSVLAPLELETINAIVDTFGKKTYNELYSPIHPPAWEKAFAAKGAKGSAPMRYEDFFEGEPAAVEAAKEALLEQSRIKQALSALR